MALKDWKKKQYGFESKNTFSMIYIDKRTDKFTGVFYQVQIKKAIYAERYETKVKEFKTKSQALRFAKDYMKKH